MIETILTLCTIFGFFGTITGFLWKLIGVVKKGFDDLKEKSNENTARINALSAAFCADIAELRSEVTLEFAKCRMHDCSGMVNHALEHEHDK